MSDKTEAELLRSIMVGEQVVRIGNEIVKLNDVCEKNKITNSEFNQYREFILEFADNLINFAKELKLNKVSGRKDR